MARHGGGMQERNKRTAALSSPVLTTQLFWDAAELPDRRTLSSRGTCLGLGSLAESDSCSGCNLKQCCWAKDLLGARVSEFGTGGVLVTDQCNVMTIHDVTHKAS
jgi:hypothetical protein